MSSTTLGAVADGTTAAGRRWVSWPPSASLHETSESAASSAKREGRETIIRPLFAAAVPGATGGSQDRAACPRGKTSARSVPPREVATHHSLTPIAGPVSGPFHDN